MRIEKLWVYAFSLTLQKIDCWQHRDAVEIKRPKKIKLTRHSFIKHEAYLKLPGHNIYCRYNFCCSVKK